MCPLKSEQARRETQQWVMRRLPTADSIVEIGKKVGHELIAGHHAMRVRNQGSSQWQSPDFGPSLLPNP